MKDELPNLKFELVGEESGAGLIRLEQYDNGEAECVVIHPLHLRHMAEQFGLIQTSDPQQHKTIQALQRRLTVLSNRLTELAGWMAAHSDHEHADLSHEMTSLNALCDLAHEWCQDWLPGMADDATAKATAPVQASLI